MVARHTSFPSESPVRVCAIEMMGCAANADKNGFGIARVQVAFYRRCFLHHVPVLIFLLKSLLLAKVLIYLEGV